MKFGTGNFRLGADGTVLGDLKVVTVNVNPASLAAAAVANTDVALPAGTAPAGSRVLGFEAPDTLEAALVPMSVSIPAADMARFRLYNPSAGAVDGAAKDWRILVLTPAS